MFKNSPSPPHPGHSDGVILKVLMVCMNIKSVASVMSRMSPAKKITLEMLEEGSVIRRKSLRWEMMLFPNLRSCMFR